MEKIIDYVIKKSDSIWDECLDTKFLIELGNDTLSLDLFKKYITEDSVYLREYVKAFALAVYKSKTMEDVKVFANALSFVNESENATRLKYMRDLSLNDKMLDGYLGTTINQEYTGYEVKISEEGDILDILAVTLPCMIGYNIVFKKLVKKYPKVLESYYKDLVNDYISDSYKECIIRWSNYTNDKALNIDAIKRERFIEIFMKSSEYELKFWKMVGNENE